MSASVRNRLVRRFRSWRYNLPWHERDRLRRIVGSSDVRMSAMCRHGHHHGPCFGCRCICHGSSEAAS